MKKKLRERIHVFWLNHRDDIIRLAGWTGIGAIVGGSLTALHDHKKIKELQESVDIHTECLDVARECVDMLNSHVCENDQKIAELARQNNLLFEKALRETEGSAE